MIQPLTRDATSDILFILNVGHIVVTVGGAYNKTGDLSNVQLERLYVNLILTFFVTNNRQG